MAKTKEQESIADIEKELRYISGIIKQKGREILNNYPITTPQFIALQFLLEHGDLTLGELSKKINLAFSTTTDLVDRMEKNDLVERVRDTKDRRVVRIHLLEKGREIIHEVIEKRQKYLGEVLSNVKEEDMEQLSTLLHLLHREMRQQTKNAKL
ncbi:MarR family winged helix-turn-helix transcriptional regulator [Gracilibacillus salinarum]|uniref:MarR family transcriptional regulator n=1 Tax=Gracilibacillus salinarum TaxID=2932255 RepID=A0ABY4GPQ7_9BACI|nr:MarR family transcriptional regulator [Gracilibacillus salinarum]UOQ86219.1 MarR family transcriptional regulator [Gracilibacillus salinarum]